MSVRKFSIIDAPFERAPGQGGDVYLGIVIDQADGAPISVGYGRCTPNQFNGETLAFDEAMDEAMVILKGRLSVDANGETITARPGEIVYMDKGTSVIYRSHEDKTVIAFVTYPHWRDAKG